MVNTKKFKLEYFTCQYEVSCLLFIAVNNIMLKTQTERDIITLLLLLNLSSLVGCADYESAILKNEKANKR